MKVEIRLMSPDDWASVKAIYLAGIATGHATFETQAPTWEAWNAGHLKTPRLVAAANEIVVGWAALGSVSSRAVYSGVAEVTVYVSGELRGHGVGNSLLESLVQESEKCGIWTLQAIVFPENQASIALHRKCGFREVGVRKRIAKMDGVWRDTLLLERRSEAIGIG